MKSKVCFKCSIDKPLSEYYKHSGMADGHLGKCKECAKKEAVDKYNENMLNEEFRVKEAKRNRNRKGGKPSYESKKLSAEKWKDKYPEKRKATTKTKRMKRSIGNHLHHWSYNEEHWKDIIEMSIKDHNKLHRFLVYDQDTFYYRDLEGNLLDTKEKHLEWWYSVKNIND